MLGGRERRSARTAAVSLRRTTELRTDLPITRGDVVERTSHVQAPQPAVSVPIENDKSWGSGP